MPGFHPGSRLHCLGGGRALDFVKTCQVRPMCRQDREALRQVEGLGLFCDYRRQHTQSQQAIRLPWKTMPQTACIRTSEVEPQSCRWFWCLLRLGVLFLRTWTGPSWANQRGSSEQGPAGFEKEGSRWSGVAEYETLLVRTACSLPDGAEPRWLKCWLSARRQSTRIWFSDP